MKLRSRGVFAALALMATAGLSACAPRQPWQNQLVSADATRAASGNGPSWTAVLSPDGTKVAFVSEASDLGPTDTNESNDVYVRDVETGTTSLMSVNAAGTDSGKGESVNPVFSPDGSKIAFSSSARDLGPTDTNGVSDVYVRDLEARTTSLVSVNTTGTDSGNRASGLPATAGVEATQGPRFSPDGNKVVFESSATDLVSGASGRNVFVRDLVLGTTSLVSVNAAGTGGGNGQSFAPVVSGAGKKIAFMSSANDLGPTDANGVGDVYVRDLERGTTTLVSVNAAGTDGGDGRSWAPTISPDGIKVAFESTARNLGPINTNGWSDIYVRDLTTGTTALVSVNAAGTDAGNNLSGLPVFSPDGDKVAFESVANDLGPVDTNTRVDIYVRDLTTGTTTLVSANAAGTDGSNGFSNAPRFSGDGSKIAFRTTANDLGPTDTNGTPSVFGGIIDGWDLYVRDLVDERTTLLSVNADGTDSGNGPTGGTAQFNADGRRIVFVSTASNLVTSGDTNGTYDVFVATLRGADLSIAGKSEPDPVEPGGTVPYRFEVAGA